MRRDPRTRVVARVAPVVPAALAAALVLAACATGPSPSPTTTPSPATASATAAASPTAASLAPDGEGAVTVDPSLLDVLPEAVEGIAMVSDEETAAEIAADPATDPAVERLDIGVYVDPSDAVETDLAIVSVVALRPGAFDETWFRTWRDSYDAAACEVADGLAPGGAEADIEDHRTWIGTCVGGVHTYHVHLPGPDRVIAVTALGSGRFGEQVVAGLKE